MKEQLFLAANSDGALELYSMNNFELISSVNLESPILCLAQISDELIAAGNQACEIFILKISQVNQTYEMEPIQLISHL